MIDIEATLEKIKQCSDAGERVAIRLKGNDDDKRRILETHCQRLDIAPVMIGELD
jgi:hypothetical protein